MSKRTKIWLIVASSLVLTGCVIFAIFMSTVNWDFTKLSTVVYETNEYVIFEDFTNITIKTNTADILFLPSKNTSATVVCNEEINMKHTVSVADNELSIEVYNTKKWYEHIGINFGTPSITVYLPQAEYRTLFIKANTGEVNLPNNFTFDSILITTSTGSVENRASASELISIKTSTGKIVTENITAKHLDLSVSTGNIEISNITCSNDVKISVSTGKSNVTDITCKNFLTDGDTGDIYLRNVVASGRFDIARSTGDVTLNECDANKIYIETDTGDVFGTLLSEKVFITSTSTGEINVPNSTIGDKCEIITDTGDITISVK